MQQSGAVLLASAEMKCVSEVMSACPGKGPRHIKLERSASSLWSGSFSAVWGPFSYNNLLRGVKTR